METLGATQNNFKRLMIPIFFIIITLVFFGLFLSGNILMLTGEEADCNVVFCIEEQSHYPRAAVGISRVYNEDELYFNFGNKYPDKVRSVFFINIIGFTFIVLDPSYNPRVF